MDQRPGIPILSLLFGFGPVLLLLLLAAVAWFAPPPTLYYSLIVAQLWGGAILVFLAGVTRGLSFDRPQGETAMQIVRMIALFVLGVAGLALGAPAAFVALALGYAVVAVADPVAARRGLAPAHFARLRPPQMAIAVIALVALAARASTLG